MLVSFSVGNFRSFGQEETLNMVASNKLTDHPEHRIQIGKTGKHVLRSGVIYGANAAGKSNLVQAMSVAQRLILSGDERPLVVEPFRFDREKLAQPSSFEFRFLLGDRVFVYGFDVTSRRIVSEWLAVLRDEEPLTIFERNPEGVARIEVRTQRHFAYDPTLFNTLGLLAQLPLTVNQLFLSRVRSLPSESQGQTLSTIVRWLTQDLVVLRAQHRTNETLDRLHRDPAFRYFSSHFLKCVGTGIGDLSFAETKRAARDVDRYLRQFAKSDVLPYEIVEYAGTSPDTYVRIQDDNPDQVVERKLLAVHDSKTGRFPLPFSEESDGTQQLLHFMPVLSPSDRNAIFVVDELDRSLHPLLCWEFIRFFSESLPDARKQLIVTTHEAHLLDQALLRRDEYWFVEKDAAQQSRLVSLSDFNIRNDLQIEKGYLQGRFGAIPVIGSMEELKRLLAQPRSEATYAAKKAPLDRDGGKERDARLIVIASEDTFAVQQYFQRFRTRRVQFIFIPTEDGRSAPNAVADRLDGFKREYATETGDQFWFCIDRDHWASSGHINNLVQVLQHCRQADYHVAISNPCLELWLLLHFEDAKPAIGAKCSEVESRLSTVAGGYDKTACDRLSINAEMVEAAVTRAKALDADPSLLIPDAPLTRVYLILESLKARDAIDFI